ncbi:MAG: PfkB family carbohydrate kinase [Verrucomicrobiae bacterium]|nr:PfkB family carbohydrate kinase [Verrucomicrobiae bacterium]
MNITPQRFHEITGRFKELTIALIGDFCLDRYLEIDPALKEISIETGLEVYNVVNVRAQPGGAGTILNNLVALGIGRIIPIGFCGEDGEGYELYKALSNCQNVDIHCFLRTEHRRTFTYCKPLVITPGKPPRELNRLDTKNWKTTPPAVEEQIISSIYGVYKECDAMIVLEQVELPNTGVVTENTLKAVDDVSKKRQDLPIIADSRRGLLNYPSLIYKMNAHELEKYLNKNIGVEVEQIGEAALEISCRTKREAFVTIGERGIIGCTPDGYIKHVPGIPPKGEIDIVGAGDSVTANLISSIAAGATLEESLVLANSAAWIVIHKLGTTGTASVAELKDTLFRQ